MTRSWRQIWFVDFFSACGIVVWFVLILYSLLYTHAIVTPTQIREREIRIFEENIRANAQGKILLQVEAQGQAWYVNPEDGKRYALGRSDDALHILRALGVVVDTATLLSIPEAEDHGEAHADIHFRGRILLQDALDGQAWYVNPEDGRRYFFSQPSDVLTIMRTLGVGVSNSDLDFIPIGSPSI